MSPALRNSNRTIDFVPYATARYVYTRGVESGAITDHFHVTGGSLELGAGFVFNQRLTVRPSAGFGVRGAPAYDYSIAFAMNFGTTRPTK